MTFGILGLAATVAAMTFAAETDASKACRSVSMATYSVCLPAGWQFRRDATLERLFTCSKKRGLCTNTGGGLPLKGIVTLSMEPADKAPNPSSYHTADDVALSIPHGQDPPPTVERVTIEGNPATTCSVARRLLSWAGVWEEVYGLNVAGRLFRVQVQFPDEPAVWAARAATVRKILSSVKSTE